MDEGKLSLEFLSKVISMQGMLNPGIIRGSDIGIDASVINFDQAKRIAQEKYHPTLNENYYFLVVKTDPITFETPNPGRYAVIINSNDIACMGGIPYGCLITLLLPVTIKPAEIEHIQSEIHKTCLALQISILGGHTEITTAVIRPVISLCMLGITLVSYLPSLNVDNRDILILGGWIANDGSAILGRAINEQKKETVIDLAALKVFEKNLYIGNMPLQINNRYKPKIIHDPTEGGVLAGLYEIFKVLDSQKGLKINSDALKSNIHPETTKICTSLQINPLRLISSGALLAIIPAQYAEEFDYWRQQFATNVPIIQIGEVIENHTIILDDKQVDPPMVDEIIKGFHNLKQTN